MLAVLWPNSAVTCRFAKMIAPLASMMIIASGAESSTLLTSSEESMERESIADRGYPVYHCGCHRGEAAVNPAIVSAWPSITTLPALLKGFFEQTFRYGFAI